jgi:adenosine deaminase
MKNTNAFKASDFALVDLHLHLDGSLTPDDIVRMAAMEGVEVPNNLNELRENLTCPVHCESLNSYLKCFRLAGSVMQSHETMAYAMERLVKRLDQQGLIYAEIRYAPQKHLRKGLTQDDVVRASLKGLEKGMAESSNGIRANIILSCMRGETNNALNEETVRLTKKYLGQGVCGTDLAGAEALYPTSEYRALFAMARELGVPFTIHAGEADGVKSMQLAIEYGARRIGHGIRAYNDEATKAMLRDRDICLECCPTSNMQTKALEGVNELSQYPLQRFLDDAIAICINTDNMTVSDTTVANELQQLHEAGILNEKQASTMLQNAIEHAFITDAEKAELKIKASQGKTN